MMRRRHCYAIAVFVLLTQLWYATPAIQANPSDRNQQDKETLRRSIADLLDGCTAIVRVYPNAANEPRRFETVRATITVRSATRRRGRRSVTISHEKVKAAYPTITTAAYIVLLGPDQTDEAVATVLAKRVYASPYREDSHLSINLGLWDTDYEPWWTFVDALGEPIAGATVEIGYPTSGSRDALHLGTTVLDKQGRLGQLRSFERLLFTVTHPDYGSARVHYRDQERTPSGTRVVPLIRLDAPEIGASIQGTVIDNEDRPVPRALIGCTQLKDSAGQPLNHDRRYRYEAVTNDQGGFSLCVPLVSEDFTLEELPPTAARYAITIEPPRQLSLRGLGRRPPLSVLAGSRTTFTLTPMEGEEAFHTFSFAYEEGPVTDAEEQRNITVTLMRDEKLWTELTYDQCQAGCWLPSGTLYASTTRWKQSFRFQPIALTTDSPEHIVIRPAKTRVYQGQVIDGTTGSPVAGAFVLANHSLASTDTMALTSDQWQRLHEQAADDTLETLYQGHDRVATSDANGFYELIFMPGLETDLNRFVAKVPGQSFTSTYRPIYDANGSIQSWTITLSPVQAPSPMPTFVFESENGPVTDPNRLSQLRFEIRNGGSSIRINSLSTFSQYREFLPGIYFAEAVWDRKLYVFEPVDLTEVRPDVVVFRPQEIRHADVIYQGQVIHGVTGRPISKAVVVRCPKAIRDASGLEPEQWTMIKSLGPRPDPTDPALIPLWTKLCGHTEKAKGPCTLTDDNGWFQIELSHPAMRDRDALLVVDEHFLGARQQLQLSRNPTSGDGTTPQRLFEPLVPDENRIVTVGPLRLFPAATLMIHPVVADRGGQSTPNDIRLVRRALAETQRSRFNEIYALSRDSLGAGMFRQWELQANVSQTVYILADVAQEFILSPTGGNIAPPVHLGGLTLTQGQIENLGRVEIDRGVQICVRVIDPDGNPVPGVRIVCIDQDERRHYLNRWPGPDGLARGNVRAHSSGRLCAVYIDRQTWERFEECVSFEVGGNEDTGHEFTLQLSQAMIKRLSQSGR